MQLSSLHCQVSLCVVRWMSCVDCLTFLNSPASAYTRLLIFYICLQDFFSEVQWTVASSITDFSLIAEYICSSSSWKRRRCQLFEEGNDVLIVFMIFLQVNTSLSKIPLVLEMWFLMILVSTVQLSDKLSRKKYINKWICNISFQYAAE